MPIARVAGLAGESFADCRPIDWQLFYAGDYVYADSMESITYCPTRHNFAYETKRDCIISAMAGKDFRRRWTDVLEDKAVAVLRLHPCIDLRCQTARQ